MHDISIYFLCFMVYSFIGWVYEVSLYLVRDKVFVNRGFLNGPYLPIYGCGAMAVVLLFGDMGDLKSTPALFFSSVMVSCILEYLTSYIMEKLFHARWWDYSDNRFNLNGRICLSAAIVFGVLSVLLIKFIHPFVSGMFYKIPEVAAEIIAAFVVGFFVTDIILTVVAITGLQKRLEEAKARLEQEWQESFKTSKERYAARKEQLMERLGVQHRRLIKAFPQMKTEKHDDILTEIREAIKEHTRKK